MGHHRALQLVEGLNVNISQRSGHDQSQQFNIVHLDLNCILVFFGDV